MTTFNDTGFHIGTAAVDADGTGSAGQLRFSILAGAPSRAVADLEIV
jgi:hypothetical protein